jgi:cholest-4-en-3-one 26-monooxygenase
MRQQLDFSDPALYEAGIPHDGFEDLRLNDPLHWQPEKDGRGFWMLTRHDDVTTVSKDWQTFSSHRGTVLLQDLDADLLAQQQLMMLNMDPPDHTKLRLLVNRGFLPRFVNQLEAHVRDLATKIVDNVIGRGECDFVTDIAMELPLQVIAEMMGVPVEDRTKLFQWSNRMIGSNDPEYAASPDDAANAAAELFMYANEIATERRKAPSDDIVSALLTAEVDGQSLSDMEFDLFFLLLTVAGNETTRNLLANSMLALFERPDQWKALVDHGSASLYAVEEFLRWGTPVMQFRRTAQRDVEMHGKQIKEGDKVSIWYSSANWDAAMFNDPMSFDVARTPNQHLSFGAGGPHHCLGAALARMEIRVMYDEIIRRIPDIRQDGPAELLRSNFIHGMKHLPIAFTPK